MALRLFLNYYRDPEPQRNSELEICLDRNLANQSIDQLVTVSSIDVPSHPKIYWVNEQDRPTYQRFFELINEFASDDDVSIITNTDIYFDEPSAQYLKEKVRAEDAYCLSRWNVRADGSAELYANSYSQDAWAFRGKIKPVGYADFRLGMPGCDNRIASELKRAGYRLLNRASRVKSYHLHLSQIRRYDRTKDTVPPPYQGVLIT